MTTYASIKGWSGTAGHLPAASPARREPPLLTPKQQAQVATNRDFVREHMPELTSMLKEMHAAGLIDGWRSVENCRLLDDGDA